MIQWWNISQDYKKPIFYEPIIDIKNNKNTANNLRNRIISHLI